MLIMKLVLGSSNKSCLIKNFRALSKNDLNLFTNTLFIKKIYELILLNRKVSFYWGFFDSYNSSNIS